MTEANRGLIGLTYSFCLTHLPLEKMAAILADDIIKCILSNGNDRILIQISLKLVSNVPFDNKWALVQVMAWRQTGAEQAIIWTKAYPVHRHKYAAPGEMSLSGSWGCSPVFWSSDKTLSEPMMTPILHAHVTINHTGMRDNRIVWLWLLELLFFLSFNNGTIEIMQCNILPLKAAH